MSTNYNLTTRAVNSKRLLTVVREMEIIFNDFHITWSVDHERETAIEIVNEMMHMLYEAGKIVQFNVYCDLRNNKISDMTNGKFRLNVEYRQKNCLNTTVLEYEIEEGPLELDLDFTL